MVQDKALAMRIINPDMKIILNTCDPIRNGEKSEIHVRSGRSERARDIDIYLIFERQFYSQLKMQERRRSEWLKKEKDISKCKACLGPSYNFRV